MPNLRPNSTSYFHSFEPNTNDLVHSMDYNSLGEPILRTALSGVGTTSKNRIQVSSQEIVLFSNALYSTDPDVWDRAVYNNATVTYDQLEGGTLLTATGDIDSEAVLQSVRVMPYVPGRGVEVTFAVQYNDARLGVRRRVGVFDELNGMYFEQDETGNYYVVIRSNTSGTVVNTRVARADWNGVKFDGTEPNGITADPDAIQMFVIEYDWYGAGQVRFNYIINGYKYTVHTFNHANIINTTFMRTPNLPVRFEIKNITGATGPFELHKWGVSVIQEGDGGSNLGRPADITNAIGGTNLGTGGTYRPVVAIRLKSTRLAGVVLPNAYQAVTTSNALLHHRITSNATITGGTWVSFGDESFIEYNITATAVSGGTVLTAGFTPPGDNGKTALDPRGLWQMSRTAMGTASQVLCLEATSAGNNVIALGSISWIEQR
jgi:hypothetical protein